MVQGAAGAGRRGKACARIGERQGAGGGVAGIAGDSAGLAERARRMGWAEIPISAPETGGFPSGRLWAKKGFPLVWVRERILAPVERDRERQLRSTLKPACAARRAQALHSARPTPAGRAGSSFHFDDRRNTFGILALSTRDAAGRRAARQRWHGVCLSPASECHAARSHGGGGARHVAAMEFSDARAETPLDGLRVAVTRRKCE
jgi:hypothetical protein